MTIVLPDPDPPLMVAPITPWLFNLAECVCAKLAATVGGATCWCGVYPGLNVAWDYCGECEDEHCGMGWVRLANVYPSEGFPLPTVDPRCRKELVWVVEVGALRCIPASRDPLEAEPMGEVVAAQMEDTWALYQAITCCDLPTVVVQNYTPTGPEGGCVGGFWTAFIGLS